MFIFRGVRRLRERQHELSPVLFATYEDYQDIRQAAHVRNAVPWIARSDLHEVSGIRKPPAGRYWGQNLSLTRISYLPLKEGRWLNELDGAQRRNVIVLGRTSC